MGERRAFHTCLTQVLADGTNTYLYGPTRIGEQQPGGPSAGSGQAFAYHLPDALGSVRQLANASAVVTLTRSYEPFGSTLSSAGVGTTAFQFAGEARDASGLVFLRARYFSTATGRFFSQDSWPGNAQMPGTLHPYLYGMNNPVRYTDPSGQCFTGAIIDAIICGAVGGAVVGGAVGAAVEYGRQVYQNYQHGRRGSDAWAECIDWGSVGRSALRGAGAGAAAGAAAPAAAYLFASGLGAEIAIGAAGGAAGNAAIQIGANALSGRPLGEGVAQAAVEGAIIGGVTAAAVGIGSRVLSATRSGGGASLVRKASSFTDEERAMLGLEAGGGGGTDDGIALIRGYRPRNGGGYPHFTVEVQYGDEVLATEQVIIARDYSRTTIVQVTGSGTPDKSVVVSLPNAGAAQDYQRSVLWSELGPYGLDNSCITHVCDVLRAGGANGVPNPGEGLRDIGYIRQLSFRDVFRR